MVFGSGIEDTETISVLYYIIPRQGTWLTPDQHWQALARVNRELTPEAVNALSLGKLCYWMEALVKEHDPSERGRTVTVMAAELDRDTAHFVLAWLDHVKQVQDRQAGPTDLTDSEEEDLPPPPYRVDTRHPDEPSTSANPPPQPTRRSTRVRRRPPP